MSSLTQRLAHLRDRKPAMPTKSRDISPGPEWSKYGEFVWERRIELSPILPKKFNTTFILPGELSTENILFYDLETTGLSGGSGNTAFLIGIAWQEGDCFTIAQLFLADYPGEQILLRRYQELSPRDYPQISYNGLSFDYQVLKTRFLINRMPALHRKQIDLLHPTRRLWKTILDNFTLGTVERELLGINRINDLPGREVPDAWFAWLRGNPNRIEEVFQHNVNDMISLARLLVLLEQCGMLGVEVTENSTPKHSLSRQLHVQEKLQSLPNELPERIYRDPSVRSSLEYKLMMPKLPEWKMPSYWGIARQWALSDVSKERKSLELGWAAKEKNCGRELARRLKRERHYHASYSIWKDLYESEKNFVSAIELSKQLEHQMKNPETALSVLDGLEDIAPGIKERKHLAYRKNRLNRKIARARLSTG
ncbi:hypothetical protein S1OALGB6SA_2363 [Olavius algarvensis spirochete endosymbiont]|uniref:ribonuclease H-like domain-containing protein n=1 Tax=Olavius algarvensis spirochete endosymbiont TaxID=260710 RepID=UPI00068A5CF9|nr:ribonuclease H-like domain-containing protein [Olavius algarvensis spirochete endosymbiont]VDB01261.1 hypothetical protein S1OALGB6SA_2363 [Olavius algarvensis spirochete endosymbiont]